MGNAKRAMHLSSAMLAETASGTVHFTKDLERTNFFHRPYRGLPCKGRESPILFGRKKNCNNVVWTEKGLLCQTCGKFSMKAGAWLHPIPQEFLPERGGCSAPSDHFARTWSNSGTMSKRFLRTRSKRSSHNNISSDSTLCFKRIASQ